jgi:NitT/TauT family transport system substrate-binding protein
MRFRSPKGKEVIALAPTSLVLAPGSFSALLGPSGCGKSTLLNAVAGFVEPSGGSILVDGKPVRGEDPEVGVVFQQYALFPWFTAIGNVQFALNRFGLSRAERRRQALAALDEVGLADRADTYPGQLSGGMKQRVATRPHAGRQAEGAADGRALRRARRADADLDARVAPGNLGQAPDDGPLRHARRRRRVDPLRLRPRDVGQSRYHHRIDQGRCPATALGAHRRRALYRESQPDHATAEPQSGAGRTVSSGGARMASAASASSIAVAIFRNVHSNKWKLRETEMSKLSLVRILGVACCLAASVALAQDKKPIVVGWGAYADVPQISVAVDKNLWKDEGLEVKVVPFNSGRESFEALIGGQLDFAIVAEFPAVIGAMRAQKFGVLASLSRYQANRIIGTDKVGLKSVKDLAGRKIGTTVGTNIHFMLDQALKGAGVTAEIVNIAPPDIVPALVRGDVEAATMFPNFYAAAKRALGDRYRDIAVKEYSTTFVLLASPEVMEKRPEVVTKFLSAMLKGEAMVTSNPAESQEAVGRVVGKALPLDVIKAGWPEYEFRIRLDKGLLDLLVKEGEWIRDRGMIKNVDPTAALFRAYFRDAPLKAVAGDRVQLQ